MLNLGKVPAGITLYIPFSTYGGTNGESITMTGLAVTDIEIYKNGSVTQRASDAGFALLDTDGIDFDSLTGIHGFSIDLSDDTDSGFFAVGSFYWVVVSAVTVDSQTVNFIAAVFRIGPAENVTGYDPVNVVSIEDDAITAAAIAADAIGASEVAAGAAQEIADALLDRADAIETGWTVRKILRVMSAALAGKLSGAATTTNTIRDVTDAKARITATVDADGNRTAITLDGA